jgi:ABC-type sugar transport system permease subunit
MFGNMFLFLVADIVTALAPPLVFAFFLTVMRNKGYSQLVRTLLFIPGVIPGIAGMLIWREGIFSNSGGVLHMLLSLFTDDPHMFLTYPTTTRFEMLLIGFPYVGAYLIFYGGMMNISDSYYEAAELEGIGIWKRFFSIDLPLILPQIKYIFITNFIHSVQNFTRVDSVTDGLQGTMTPIKMIYDKINESGAYGEASAYATLMFVFLFFATAINLRKKKQEVEV